MVIYSLIFNEGKSRPLFRPFHIPTSNIHIEKSIDGVLEIRTLGHRLVIADETTELWLVENVIIVENEKIVLVTYAVVAVVNYFLFFSHVTVMHNCTLTFCSYFLPLLTNLYDLNTYTFPCINHACFSWC